MAARQAPTPPFFSVVIPTYSRPAEIARCLESLARLEYPRNRFEVIVVDDGSEPPLGGVEERFRDRLDVTVLWQKNAGPATARNAGAAVARGELLAFTDDDCAPEPGWLAALATRFAEAGGSAVVGGKTVNALDDNPFSAASQAILDVVYAHYNADLERPLFFASNNFALPAGRFRDVGGFDAAFRFAAAEDRELCNRLVTAGDRLVYAPDARVRHAHVLTLGGFWRQHFGYGRGAFHFHALCARRGSGRFALDFGLYEKLLLHPLSERPLRRTIERAALIFVSQLANAAGFFREYAALGRER